MNPLFAPMHTLLGVGKDRAEKYAKLGIETPFDLLYHFPRTYVDYSKPVYVADATPDVPVAVCCTIVKKIHPQYIHGGLAIYKLVATDGVSDFTIVFYNNRYTYQAMHENEAYYAYGKVIGGLLKKEMRSPMIQRVEEAMLLQPIYPQTQGLSSTMIRTNMKRALSLLDASVETITQDLMQKYHLVSLHDALYGVHMPQSQEQLVQAQRRLAFEELLLFQLGIRMLRHRVREGCTTPMNPNTDLRDFFAALPFTVTTGQSEAIQTIFADLCSNRPMNRLLQGDVGSGKTVVAAAACAYAAKNGMQSVLMAPTEILAQQHCQTLSAFLAPIGLQPVLLTGSTRAKQKKEIKAQIADMQTMVVVGTHAVIQKDILFANLGLVITDEQHRFGVAQRAALAEKGGVPHKLVMSATPIPRTLALIIYGDLDVTVIREMPKGRLPIQTFAVTGGYRERAYNFIRKRLDAGEQAYLVCAMIEDSEQMENIKAAESYAETVKKGAFSNYRVGVLHGRMKPAEKEKVMAEMKAHTLDLLVCTTVVEVGVDIPNATVILIENADRFGLAQLHQLRGRVGRSDLQSYCILVTDSRNEESRERLKIMSRTTSGFEIAEEDLKLRGPGDFFGNAQHGIPPMLQTALTGDMSTVAETQNAADLLLREDPQLKAQAHQSLRLAVLRMFRKNGTNGLN